MIRLGVVVERRPKRRRLTLRDLADIIAGLRIAEERRIHADRDKCLGCLIQSEVMTGVLRHHLPKRYLENDWQYAHVLAPAARRFAREQTS